VHVVASGSAPTAGSPSAPAPAPAPRRAGRVVVVVVETGYRGSMQSGRSSEPHESESERESPRHPPGRTPRAVLMGCSVPGANEPNKLRVYLAARGRAPAHPVARGPGFVRSLRSTMDDGEREMLVPGLWWATTWSLVFKKWVQPRGVFV